MKTTKTVKITAWVLQDSYTGHFKTYRQSISTLYCADLRLATLFPTRAEARKNSSSGERVRKILIKATPAKNNQIIHSPYFVIAMTSGKNTYYLVLRNNDWNYSTSVCDATLFNSLSSATKELSLGEEILRMDISLDD